MQKLCIKNKTFFPISFKDSIGTQYATRTANVKVSFRALKSVNWAGLLEGSSYFKKS